MSFGFSPSDVVLLGQLAWTTVQNSRKACGEYAELTRETTSLHINLQRLERETAKPESPINRPSDTCREELAPIVNGCGKALGVLDTILEKYNALNDGERRKGKLWKEVRFANGEWTNVKDLRLKLNFYTSNLSLFLNMVSMGSMGIVEKQMHEAGGDLKDIRRAVNGITANLMSGANKEGSVLTDYADDDKAVWRAFRRELVKAGFSSDVIREHKDTIQAYVKELGSRGILDDEGLKDSGNVSEDLEDTAPAQANPQSRDQAMESFESKSGAAGDTVNPHTATAAHIDSSFGNADREPRDNRTFPQQTQIASPLSTLNNVSDTLPLTTQAGAEINSVVEGDSRKVEKVDDRTNRHRPSAPNLGPTELAEEAPWFLGPRNFGLAFRYLEYHYHYRGFLFKCLGEEHKDFKVMSNPLAARGVILEFQDGANGFLKVAELRTRLQNPIKPVTPVTKAWLKLSPLFDSVSESAWEDLNRVTQKGRPSNIIHDLLQCGLRSIDANPERWRITEWPLPGEKIELEGHEDGDKGKRSTATAKLTEGGQAHVPPHATAAVVEETPDPSSTKEELKTKNDDEIERTGNHTRTEEEQRNWEALVTPRWPRPYPLYHFCTYCSSDP